MNLFFDIKNELIVLALPNEGRF